MEPFLRKRLTFLSFFWDKIWPVAAPDDGLPGLPERTADFSARGAGELSVRRGDRPCALREDGDYLLARRLSGPPSPGPVPLSHLARAAPEPEPEPEPLPDRP